MQKNKFEFHYQVFDDIHELDKQDAQLLSQARAVTAAAYAPYSRFLVGAAALLKNGEIIKGTNQENASYPVGICAERVLLGTAATMFPEMPIESMAISYQSNKGNSDQPISPCGMCRQSLLEFETRTNKSIRIILSGQAGKVIVVDTAANLLPFAFSGQELI